MEKEHREDVLFHFGGFRPLQIYMVLKLIHRRTALKLVFKNFIFDIEYKYNISFLLHPAKQYLCQNREN